jgi:hypothetical protein
MSDLCSAPVHCVGKQYVDNSNLDPCCIPVCNLPRGSSIFGIAGEEGNGGDGILVYYYCGGNGVFYSFFYFLAMVLPLPDTDSSVELQGE